MRLTAENPAGTAHGRKPSGVEVGGAEPRSRPARRGRGPHLHGKRTEHACSTPDLQLDLQGAGEAFEDVKQMGLSGEKPLGEVKTKAPNSDYHQIEPPVGCRAGLPQARSEDR